MIEQIPFYVSFIFVVTTLITLLYFIQILNTAIHSAATKYRIILGLVFWLLTQGLLAFNGLYSTDKDFLPPKIILFGILPAILFIAFVFVNPLGRKLISDFSLKQLTYLSVIRIPVELVLFWLYLCGTIPKLMTFEGRNLDILAGVSAPIVAYCAFRSRSLNRKILIVWNFLSLILLLNIVVNALFSAPSPFQQFAFDQPNIALLYFPFSWLPTFIVPVILFSHLVSLYTLFRNK